MPEIVIFSGSGSTFPCHSFGPVEKIWMNPRDGGFPKRPKLYISSLKLAGFAGSEVEISFNAGFAGSGGKISFNVRGGISTQGSEIVIISGPFSTFTHDSFGPGEKLRMNPGDGRFPKRTKLYISSLKLAGFAGSGEEISFNVRGDIFTQGPEIVMFSGSCSTFPHESFGPEEKITMNPRDAIIPKRHKLQISSLR
ncbi:hypothetical protein ACROYT_G033660 [Oculina patagonica]